MCQKVFTFLFVTYYQTNAILKPKLFLTLFLETVHTYHPAKKDFPGHRPLTSEETFE